MKKILFLFLVLLFVSNAFAQDIEVKKFEPVEVHGDGFVSDSEGNLEPSDLHCRQVLLDYIEQLRTAFNMKDINFLKTVLGADSLGNISFTDYKGFTSTYFKNIIRVFKTDNKMIAKINDIKVEQHTVKKNLYGVSFLLTWVCGNYHDEGYLFQLWDFTESSPQIHITTWQPSMINGQPLPDKKRFGLKDFDI